MGPKTCKVCDNAQSKYKCPNCLIPYCSLPCFRKHKEVPCAKPEPSLQQQLPAAPLTELEKVCYVDEPSDVLQQFQLESIASSTEIREALNHEELKKLIYNIDCSADAGTELDKAMEVEAFCIFSEKVLSTICS